MENNIKTNFFKAFEELLKTLPEKVNFVIKIDRRTGNYEGRDYDNTNLITVAWRATEEGEKVTYFETIKLRTPLFNAMPCAVGDCVVASYNRYGSVQELHKI